MRNECVCVCVYGQGAQVIASSKVNAEILSHRASLLSLCLSVSKNRHAHAQHKFKAESFI